MSELKTIRIKIVGKNTNITIDNKTYTLVDISEQDERSLYKNTIFYNQNNSDLYLNRILSIANPDYDKKEAKLDKLKAEKKLLKHKQKEITSLKKSVFEETDDFYVNDGDLMIKNYDIKFPSDYIDVIKSSKEKGYSLKGIKNFLLLLAMNPSKYVRDNVFSFFIKQNFPITENGYIVCLRRVWKVNKDYNFDNKEFSKFIVAESDLTYKNAIINAYHKVKLMKKSPKKYYLDLENKLTPKFNVKGSIADLYEKYKSKAEETFYTDAYSKTFKWSLKTPAFIKREQTLGSEDSQCGTFLHLGSTDYVLPESSLGNVILLCLVNPTNCTNIPPNQSFKFGACEYYPVTEIKREDADSIFKDPFQVVGTVSNDYERCIFNIPEDVVFSGTLKERKKAIQSSINGVREAIQAIKSSSKLYSDESPLTEEQLIKIVEQKFIEI